MKKTDQHFNQRLKELVEFKKTNGRWPELTSKDFDERSIGVWTHKIKLLNNRGLLSEERRNAIEKSGFPLTPRQNLWNQSAKELEQYVKKHHRLPDSKNKLYNFSLRQYLAFDKLSVDKKKVLKSFGFIKLWKSAKRDSERIWDEHLTEVKKFVSKYGALPTRRTNASLEHWVTHQRRLWKKNLLRSEQKKKFKNAGIDLLNRSFEKKDWDERYEEVKTFIVKNSRLPKYTAEPSEERALYMWCITQALAIRKEKLSKANVDKFRKLEFAITRDPGYYQNQFDKFYDQLIQFKTQNNRWPRLHSENKEENILAFWCYRRKKEYFNETLSADKLEALQKIDFPFERRNRTEDEIYEQLKSYIIENKKFPTTNSLYHYFYARKFKFEKADDELKRLLKTVGYFNKNKTR